MSESDNLRAFLSDLQQTITLTASEEGNERGTAETFTEHMIDVLNEAGEIDGGQTATYRSSGSQASGFALSEDETTLWLFLTDYRGEVTPQSLVKADLDVFWRRMGRFLDAASGVLWQSLEESSDAWDMAHRIAEVWPQVSEVRLMVFSTAILKTDVRGDQRVNERVFKHFVWDLERQYKLASSGRAQEPITLDLNEIWGEPIPCLPPVGSDGEYRSFLLVFPGELLSRIYEMYGPRLLELNVRSFLQARGAVNRGIQETLREQPGRFMAYNNGISATASNVDVVESPHGGVAIERIHDLQIVNGGQTTASVHLAAKKHALDLSQVAVQAKLSVIQPDILNEMVPEISRYANSQNKIQMADFSANDPFHVELEKLSRTIWAPGKNGTGDLTRWFYERARGQYADAHANERTPARQRQFKKLHPTAQRMTKTDVAKYENTWDQLPWVVSLGAEKNFRNFMIRLEKRGTFKPDKAYFERLVAKAILFRSAERLIGGQQLGGYRAQTVTYTLAKLLNVTGQRLDLSAVWRTQEVSSATSVAILDLGPRVHEAIIESAGVRNVGEWAKKEGCWKVVAELDWEPAKDLLQELDGAATRTRSSSAHSIDQQLSPDEQTDLEFVMSLSGDGWKALSAWAKETNSLQPWQRGLAFSIGKLLHAERIPSRKQVKQGALILTEVQRLGFSPD